MKIFAAVLLLSIASYGQNAFEESRFLNDAKVTGLKQRIDKIKEEPDFAKYDYQKDIVNFRLFLENPFTLDLSKINVVRSVEYLGAFEQMIAVKRAAGAADGDGDGISDKDDACPDDPGIVLKNGCPESKKAQVAITGQDMTTVLVDALAQFLVDRVKQELTITFYENFRKRLKDTITFTVKIEGNNVQATVRLKDVLPNTFLLLESKQYFDTPSLGKTWVTAFKKDLINLPQQLEFILRSSDNKQLANTNAGQFTLMSFDVIEQLKRGDHPITVIENIDSQYNAGKDYGSKSKQLLGLLSLISTNLSYFKEEGNQKIKVWCTSDDLQKLDDTSKKFLAGLIFQQGVESGLFEKITLGAAAFKDAIREDNYFSFYASLYKMSADFKTIAALLEKVKRDAAQPQTSKALEDYAVYLSNFYSLFDENMTMIYQVFGDTAYYDSFYFKTAKAVSQDIIGFNSALAQKDYAECILLSANLLQHLLYNGQNDDLEDRKIIKEFFYYSNFLADIIAASESGNSENVKKIIENYAMPVGSYRIKRSYSHSWDLSAFPGIYMGYEFDSSKSWSYGITAPVGISFSRKHFRKKKDSSCSTFFLSVIDIGAPFSYRFANDQAQGLPEQIKWEQIFAPGLFYIYGFKNTPISLSFGGQITPLLREITDQNNVLMEENIFRLSLGLLVDIPIFNLKKGSLN
ncbi:hypothetical protein [uncultured Flavobacterium sp.]|uniref:hypothetical protein n=1 Tax=uncultured Flavobacterium sp. TaxID=165435 RepID=UPI0025935B05|nr:hypothetical protein [uncultured Flavobacterium sp.]